MKKVTWLPKNVIPEELHNAALVVREFGEVSKAASNNLYSLLFNAAFLLGGFLCGYFISDAVREKVTDSIVGFCAIVIGFVITAMLFSGRNQSADRLHLDQAKIYAVKTRFILLSQTQTLIAYLFCAGFCVLSTMLNGVDQSLLDSPTVFALALGYFLLGVYRTMFLPFQIYDVHSFALDSLLREKEEQAKKAIIDVAKGFKPKS